MRGKRYLAAVLFGMVVTIKTKAETSSLRLPQADGVSSLTAPKPETSKPAQVYGQIRFEGMQYLTPIESQPQLTYSQLLSARLSSIKETHYADFAGDISGGTFFSRGQSHYVVHEAYVASNTSLSKTFKATLGRRKFDWSEMDKRWQLGLWQPNFAIDALRPEEQGLVGIFLEDTRPNLQFVVFGSPLFIPTMGPDIHEEDGGLVADSRWYRSPSRKYDFNSRVNSIQYDLDVPDAMKLASNQSIAAMTRIGSKEQGPWMVVSAGRMPVNDLILSRQNFKSASSDQVDVTVVPAVTYHTLVSTDVGYTSGNVTTSVSYSEDKPQEKRPDEDWSIQKLEAIKAFSFATDFSLADIFSRTLAIQLGYLKVDGGGIQDILYDGQPDDFTLFDTRTKFYNAAQFRVEGQLASLWKRPLVTRFKYLYDFDQRGSLLNTEFLYYPSQKWALLMGADVLGVQDNLHDESGFLNQYRANDRLYGGMTYVF